jgi:virginiamycin B lyase
MVRYGLKGHKRVYGLPYGGPGGSGDAPFYLAAAPDGSVWYTQVGSGQTSISHLSLNGQVTQYPYVGDYAGLVVGGDGALWFADYGNDAIARLSP